MVRTMKWMELAAPQGRWQAALAAVLQVLGLGLLAWAERLQARRQAPAAVPLEVAPLAIGGQRGAALYEGGRLVAWLPGVERL